MKKYSFQRKDRKLSAYAFACGYIEESSKDGIHVRLWMENGCPDPYNVKSYDRNRHQRLDWKMFPTINEARKDFNRQIREGRKG